jgi:hypothetical protein
MTVLLGIDGTGVWSETDYARDFRHSFVNYIYHHTSARAKRYIRGPAATLADLQSGSDTPFLISEGFTFVELAHDGHEDVLLTGYSRGAAAVVGVAQRLVGRGIRVTGLMLFDCVDRCPLGVDTMEIPTNVAEVVHVMRDPASESRESFANSGLLASPPTVYNGVRVPSASSRGHQRRFMGTHGAMGGVPWRSPVGGDPHTPDLYIDEGFPDDATRITFARDLACSTEIWSAVRGDLRRLGFIP